MTTPINYLEKYRDPLNIQTLYLSTLEEKITNGASIGDTNNVFSFCVEMNSYLSGHFMNEIANNFAPLYSSRAQTSEDLYKHLADNEYIGLFYTPASCSLEIVMDAQYLIANAESFNEYYKKVVIPKESTFNLSEFKFGIYYPIEIRINKFTNTFQIAYDGVTYGVNPLHTLSQNTINHKIINFKGLELLSFNIPIYQFETETIIEELISQTGFVKAFDYTTNFYAIRIFNFTANSWVEIKKTFSDQIYDPTTLTAKVSLQIQLNKVNVIIPQIYFTEGLIGTKLKIVIYSTLGAIDVDTTEIPLNDVSVLFQSTDASVIPYSSIFNTIQTLDVYPASTRILGGANGYTFEQLQERVVNNSFYNKVLITPKDIDVWFGSNGFKSFQYQNGMLNRVYYCLKNFTDTLGETIPAAMLPAYFTIENLTNTKTIMNNGDGTYTVLPNTLYLYSVANNTTIPLTNAELDAFSKLSKTQLVSALNNNIYLRSTLFTKVNTNSQFPYASSYSLDSPEITETTLIAENIEMNTQLTVVSSVIANSPNYTGYQITLTVQRTEDLIKIAPNNFVIYICINYQNKTYYTTATHIGKTATGLDLYTVDLTTQFIINERKEILINNLSVKNKGTLGPIPLSFTIDIVSLINKRVLPKGYVSNEGGMRQDLPANQYVDYIALAEQSLNIELGQSVTAVFNKVDLSYTDLIYATYQTTTYGVYSENIIKEDSKGIPIYTRSVVSIGSQVFTCVLGSSIATPKNIAILKPGYIITGSSFKDYTYITEVGTTTVTLSAPSSATGSFTVAISNVVITLEYSHLIGEWVFGKTEVNTYQATLISGNAIINLNSVVGIAVGMKISGQNIPINASVLTITSTGITVSNAPKSSGSFPVQIGIPLVVHAKGDNILDNEGNPIITGKRNEVFYVDKILTDAKLYYLTGFSSMNYTKIVGDLLETYCTVTATLKSQLLENTEVYYQPIRSLGNANFLIDGTTTVSLPLELTLQLKIYVFDFVYENAILLERISKTCITLVGKALEQSPFSLTDISNIIKKKLPEYIKYIDVLGIDNNITLQTIISSEDNTFPIIKRVLELDSEENIIMTKALKIEYISIQQ